jgi:hypothetical protein
MAASPDLGAGREFGLGRVLAALEGADVEEDGPAVVDRDLGRIAHHRVEAVRDRVEELAVGHLDGDRVGRHQVAGLPGAAAQRDALGHDAVAGAVEAVARRAVDVVALLAAVELVGVELERRRQLGDPLTVAQAAVVGVVGAEVAAGDRARHLAAVAATVGEEVELGVGLHLLLEVHAREDVEVRLGRLAGAGLGDERQRHQRQRGHADDQGADRLR